MDDRPGWRRWAGGVTPSAVRSDIARYGRVPEALIYLDHPQAGLAVRVFAALDRVRGRDGSAFPRREDLAERLHVTERTIDRGLDILEQCGFIEIERRGKRLPNTYTLIFPLPGESTYVSTHEADESTQVSSHLPENGGGEWTQMSTPIMGEVIHTNNPSVKPRQCRHIDDFETWYAAFPRRVERKQALKSYLARRSEGISADDLLTAATNYAKVGRETNRSVEFTKHPATFLNNGRWEDWLPGGAALTEHESKSSSSSVLVTMGNGSTIRMLR